MIQLNWILEIEMKKFVQDVLITAVICCLLPGIPGGIITNILVKRYFYCNNRMGCDRMDAFICYTANWAAAFYAVLLLILWKFVF